jgi:hypothetical protein
MERKRKLQTQTQSNLITTYFQKKPRCDISIINTKLDDTVVTAATATTVWNSQIYSDILQLCFQFLSIEDFIKCRSVCKYWKDVNMLEDSLAQHDFRARLNDLDVFYKRFPNLNRLFLNISISHIEKLCNAFHIHVATIHPTIKYLCLYADHTVACPYIKFSRFDTIQTITIHTNEYDLTILDLKCLEQLENLSSLYITSTNSQSIHEMTTYDDNKLPILPNLSNLIICDFNERITNLLIRHILSCDHSNLRTLNNSASNILNLDRRWSNAIFVKDDTVQSISRHIFEYVSTHCYYIQDIYCLDETYISYLNLFTNLSRVCFHKIDNIPYLKTVIDCIKRLHLKKLEMHVWIDQPARMFTIPLDKMLHLEEFVYSGSRFTFKSGGVNDSCVFTNQTFKRKLNLKTIIICQRYFEDTIDDGENEYTTNREEYENNIFYFIMGYTYQDILHHMFTNEWMQDLLLSCPDIETFQILNCKLVDDNFVNWYIRHQKTRSRFRRLSYFKKDNIVI